MQIQRGQMENKSNDHCPSLESSSSRKSGLRLLQYLGRLWKGKEQSYTYFKGRQFWEISSVAISGDRKQRNKILFAYLSLPELQSRHGKSPRKQELILFVQSNCFILLVLFTILMPNWEQAAQFGLIVFFHAEGPRFLVKDLRCWEETHFSACLQSCTDSGAAFKNPICNQWTLESAGLHLEKEICRDLLYQSWEARDRVGVPRTHPQVWDAVRDLISYSRHDSAQSWRRHHVSRGGLLSFKGGWKMLIGSLKYIGSYFEIQVMVVEEDGLTFTFQFSCTWHPSIDCLLNHGMNELLRKHI